MPYLIPATNNIFGLQPANGPQGRTNLYSVSSSEATNILTGDALVWISSVGTVRAVVTADRSTNNAFAGVAAAGLSTASYAFTNFNLLVYDDPMQVYAIAVTTSLGVSQVDYGRAFTFVTTATGTGIPSTAANVGRSKMAMNPVNSTDIGYIKMIGLHPVEALAAGGFVVTTSVGKPQKYLVMPNIDGRTVSLTT